MLNDNRIGKLSFVRQYRADFWKIFWLNCDRTLMLIPGQLILLTFLFSCGQAHKTSDNIAQHRTDTTITLDIYNKAILSDSNNATIYYKRALIFSRQQKHAEALADLNKAIQIKPDYAEAYYERGFILCILESNFPPRRGCQDICKAYSLGYPRQQDGISNNCDCKNY